MDLDMPRMDGIEATRRILDDRPETSVLVLTSFSDRPRILGALDAGASGYLLKDAASDDVAGGIRAAARGEAPLDPRAARTILAARAEPDPLAGLSAREREVLELLVQGLPNKLIARKAADQRQDGEVAPDADLPRARRHRPHAGRAVGRAPRAGRRMSQPASQTKVALPSRPRLGEPCPDPR